MLESLPTTSTGSSASSWRINDVEITDFALARQAMTPNKQTIQKYMDAFGRTDHAEILSCLTDDVEWLIPGAFHVAGKQAFDEQIENDAFVGRPTIRVTRMIEENGVVVAEGSVSSAKKDGGMLNAVFCDVFVMRDAKIRHLTSYLTVTAVVVVGKEGRFLPGVKRIFHSVNPRPPQRDRAAEQALAGAQFSAIETRPGGSSGSFSTIFEFASGNRVKRTMIVSGIVGLSDVGGGSEEWGTYEVIGDEVHLSFDSGSDALVLTTEQGHFVALRRDGRVYRRR